ncbi:hypothetical protein J3F84DRAFT_379059 [Trichoderma pleuroticola]
MDVSSFTPQILECVPHPTKQKVREFRRKRAAIACVACRRRKVRCDVAEHGLPCCNCELDQTECKVQTTRRKRFKPCYRQIGSPKDPNYMPPTPVQSITTPSSDEMPNFSAQQTYLDPTSEHDINGLLETSPCTSDEFNGPEELDWQRRLSSLPLGDITKLEVPFGNMHCLNCSTQCYQKFNDVLDGIRKAVDLLYEAMAIPAQIMKNSQETIPPASSLRSDILDDSQNVETQELDCNDLSNSSFISQLLQGGEDGTSSLSAGSPSIYIGSDNLDVLVGNTQGLEEITDPT